MKFPSLHHRSTERISQYILYALIALTALLFVLFWAVGYDRPFEDDPNFVEPLFTNALLVFMFLLLVAAVAVAAWAVSRSLKKRGHGERMSNNIPIKLISYSVTGLTCVLLVLTFLFGSSSSITINGNAFADYFWLKMSDMFVNTSLGMILIALGAVVFGLTRYYRKSS